MKIKKFLNGFLYYPDPDFSVGSDFQSTETETTESKESKETQESSEDTEEQPDDDEESASAYMRKQLESYRSQREDAEDEEEEEDEQDNKSKKSDKSDSKDDAEEREADKPKSDDPLGIDPDSLVDSKGEPVTASTKESFQKLREAATRFKTELDELKKKYEGLDPDEYKRVQEEYNKYKEIVETEHFEKDPLFVKEYKEPIAKHRSEAQKWAGSVTNEGERQQFLELMMTASSFLNEEQMKDENTEVRFAEVLDKATDMLSPVAGRKFVDSMVSLYDSYARYFKARENKNETLSQLRTTKEKQLEQEVSSASSIIEASLKGWDERNSKRVEFYNEHEEGKFTEERSARMQSIKDGLRNFKLTGEVTPSFAQILVDASVAGGLQRNEERTLKTLTNAIDAYQREKKRAEDLERRLKKIAGSSLAGKSSSDDDDDEADDLSKPLSSILKKAINA